MYTINQNNMLYDDDADTNLKRIVFADYKFHVIVAHSYPEFGIGIEGSLPWNYTKELRYFKNITTKNWLSNDNLFTKEINDLSQPTKNIVVFGRQTWEHMNEKGKQNILKNRVVIVISNSKDVEKKADNEYWTPWDNLINILLELRHNLYISNHVFFSGGQTIYKQALTDYPIECVHVTEVYLNERSNRAKFDTFFPSYTPHNWCINSHCFINPDSFIRLGLYECSPFISETDKNTGRDGWYRHKTYCSSLFANDYSESFTNKWISDEAEQYLAIMNEIMQYGIDRDDRTGIGTRSIFSSRQLYDLSDTFPIITTRHQWLRGIFEELKLYLSGKTDNTILQDKGINIWNGNTSREFLNSRGLDDYPEGDMGETYGFNFRHFGGKYENCKSEYRRGENGFDQVENVINLIKTDPTSRRIIINLWNPSTTHKAALPSCLMMYQFFVDTRLKTLNCQIYIRSSDYFLANNWNCCTGALLVYMICALKDIPYTPGFISVVTGDTHIYKTHFKQVNENLTRDAVPFPKLEINKEKVYETLEDFEFADLRLIGYQAQPTIYADMAV